MRKRKKLLSQWLKPAMPTDREEIQKKWERNNIYMMLFDERNWILINGGLGWFCNDTIFRTRKATMETMQKVQPVNYKLMPRLFQKSVNKHKEAVKAWTTDWFFTRAVAYILTRDCPRTLDISPSMKLSY